jgi:hypothetical protein
MSKSKFRKMSLIGLSLLSVGLGGCAPEDRKIIVDQCLRNEIFQQCMKILPRGPRTTGMSNDWDEVVKECGEQGFYQSKRKREFVKPECQAE